MVFKRQLLEQEQGLIVNAQNGELAMADRVRFGPAGIPPIFKALGAELHDVPKLLRTEGLDALEYEAVRWGQKPQITRQEALRLGMSAKENDLALSMHGSYFVNLLGQKTVVEASKRRLIACAASAAQMGANVLVFHAGFYGNHSRTTAMAQVVKALRELVEAMKQLGIRKLGLGPETMGKPYQFGSLEEVLHLCVEVEGTQPVIDWAHLHARENGRFKNVEDYRAVFIKVEKELDAEAAKNLHCHFSKIEFTSKGERRHRCLDEQAYGPDFTLLAKVIREFSAKPVLICETPLLDADAVKMREIFMEKSHQAA